jgi:hypothetical protein
MMAGQKSLDTATRFAGFVSCCVLADCKNKSEPSLFVARKTIKQ